MMLGNIIFMFSLSLLWSFGPGGKYFSGVREWISGVVGLSLVGHLPTQHFVDTRPLFLKLAVFCSNLSGNPFIGH